jgi:enoyl-CoA hydratase/carnithine racemase
MRADNDTSTTAGAPRNTLVLTVGAEDGRPILDRSAYVRLDAILSDAARNDDIKVVVLRGLAGCFCLGGDISEFLDDAKHERLIAAVTGLFRTLAGFPKPLIASVDGDAVGVGCTMLFHCDLVYATPRSTFRVPFVDLGLVPDAATSILAPQRLGYSRAFRFFCLGDPLTAEQALAIDLVSEVDRSGAPDRAALDAARSLARKPATALANAKALLKGDIQPLREVIDREILLFRDALRDEGTRRRLRLIARRAA